MDQSLTTAFGKLENIHIEHENALQKAEGETVKAKIVQAVNVPSLVSMALIANTTVPDGTWTQDISYAMPQFVEKGRPSSLDINWMFVSSHCDYGTYYTGMNYGSIDVTYSSTKQCFPLPVQNVDGE